jgi:hypothetical protein
MPPTAATLSGIASADSRSANGKRKKTKTTTSGRRDDLEEPRPPPSFSQFNPFQQYMSQIENTFGVTSIENSAVREEDGLKNNLNTFNSSVSIASSSADLYAIQVMQYHEDDHDEISTLGDESMLIRRGSKIGAARALWKEPTEVPPKQDVEEHDKVLPLPPFKQQQRRNNKTDVTKKSNSTAKMNKPKLLSPSQQDTPDQVMEIKMDKSKSRSGNTFLMGLFSKTYSTSQEEPEQSSEAVQEITPKSVDIYTTVGDPEEPSPPHFEFDDRSVTFLQKNKRKIIHFTVCLAIFLLAVAAVTLTFSLLHAQENNVPLFDNIFGTQTIPPDSGDTFPPAFAPLLATQSPTVAAEKADPPTVTNTPPPQVPPTVTPTSNSLTKVKSDLLSIIANRSEASLRYLEESVVNKESTHGSAVTVPTTPHSSAFEWLINDPYYWTYTQATKLQRWVLAVFYYSTGGDDWKTENFPPTFQLGKAPWLNYSSECLWESTNKGSNGDICNDPTESASNDTMAHADIFALHLRNVGLNGTIPEELNLLTSLRIIFANGNAALRGTLPTELGRLSQMEKLQLSNNGVEGTIPTEIGTWTQLRVAGFGNNAMEGTLPTELGLWTNIVALGMQGNLLSGTLPTEYGQMNQIESVSMERNQLTGTIPWQWTNMESLVSFSVQNNLLTGDMPEDMCYMNDLDELIADCASALYCWCCSECF